MESASVIKSFVGCVYVIWRRNCFSSVVIVSALINECVAPVSTSAVNVWPLQVNGNTKSAERSAFWVCVWVILAYKNMFYAFLDLLGCFLLFCVQVECWLVPRVSFLDALKKKQEHTR